MISIDRRYFHFFDWLSLILVLVISAIGLATIYSATHTASQPYSIFFKKQCFGLVTGLLLYSMLCCIDYRTLCRFGYGLYWLVIALLFFTILKGSVGLGAQRWIDLKIIKFQPSELTKLFFAPFITYYFYILKEVPSFTLKDFLFPGSILLVSCFLILKQPDLGTSLIILFSGLITFWLIGLSKRYFFIGLITVLCISPLLWQALKPYQKKRIAVFLGEGQVHNERYQIEQSKIAIGSGGLTGKGFLHGTQNTLNFLPERRTDFIFSVFCEEWGFLGALFLLGLYAILFIRLLLLISTINNIYAQILAFSLLIPLIISSLINSAMVMSLLPAVGIPLPFMTYGISHTWISFACLGWINNILCRRFFITPYS